MDVIIYTCPIPFSKRVISIQWIKLDYYIGANITIMRSNYTQNIYTTDLVARPCRLYLWVLLWVGYNRAQLHYGSNSSSKGRFNECCSTGIMAWTSNYIHGYMCDIIIRRALISTTVRFCQTTVKFMTCRSNYFQLLNMVSMTYPWPKSHLYLPLEMAFLRHTKFLAPGFAEKFRGTSASDEMNVENIFETPYFTQWTSINITVDCDLYSLALFTLTISPSQ